MPTSGPISSPPRWAVSSDAERRTRHLAAIVISDGKVEVGPRVRLVDQRVVPPLALVGAKTAGLHERAKAAAVARFDLRDSARAMMRDRIHQVIVTAHARKLAGRQVIERQVDGAPPAVA